MYRVNRISGITSKLIKSINNNGINNTKLSSSMMMINKQHTTTNTTTTICKNNNINYSIRLYSNDNNKSNKIEDQLPHPGINKPSNPFSMNLDKYKIDEKVEDLNPDHLVYQSKREPFFKAAKYFLTSQSILGISAPVIAYINHLEMKTVLFLSVFSFWSLSFQLIGQKMASCFGVRIYREPGSKYIKLCHYNPSLKVLLIPLEDIQLTKIAENGSPYILLDNGALFFFEKDGDLYQPEEFDSILSGEEYQKKMKRIEQDEYKKYFETPSTSIEDLEQTSKLMDYEMDVINQKLQEAKDAKEKEDAKDK